MVESTNRDGKRVGEVENMKGYICDLEEALMQKVLDSHPDGRRSSLVASFEMVIRFLQHGT